MTVPILLCGAMLAMGMSAAALAGLDIRPLWLPYILTAVGATGLVTLAFVFIETCRLAAALADNPLRTIADSLRPRAPLLVLPAIIFPLFLIGFTASKSAIAFLVGYSWDPFWAEADRLIFRDDVWRITRSIFGSSSSAILEWFYTYGWGGMLVFVSAAIPIAASRRTVAVYYTAMFATWLLGGCVLAYCFSAAGPAFAHIFEPQLDLRFAPMRQILSETLGNGSIGVTQKYLATSVHGHTAFKGGGISAMPSMHLGAAAIYVLAARGTKWLFPTFAFWMIIFIGSGYFGYHYWVDDLAAAGVAWLCWKLAETYFGRRLQEVDAVSVEGVALGERQEVQRI